MSKKSITVKYADGMSRKYDPHQKAFFYPEFEDEFGTGLWYNPYHNDWCKPGESRWTQSNAYDGITFPPTPEYWRKKTSKELEKYNTISSSKKGGSKYGYTYHKSCGTKHTGEPIEVGDYVIHAGGSRDLTPKDLVGADFVVPLDTNKIIGVVGQSYRVLLCPWQDRQAPPKGFLEFLQEHIIPLLQDGSNILVYCIGSHGRTGTFIASLIALLEPNVDDPIAEVRSRHCDRAVESRQQAEYIFELHGKKLPEKYNNEFPEYKSYKGEKV